jgi:hypothetical protein
MTGGPNAMAAKIADTLDDLRAQREVAERRAERKVLNKRIFMLEGLLAWCKSRVGYVEPDSACNVRP